MIAAVADPDEADGSRRPSASASSTPTRAPTRCSTRRRLDGVIVATPHRYHYRGRAGGARARRPRARREADDDPSRGCKRARGARSRARTRADRGLSVALERTHARASRSDRRRRDRHDRARLLPVRLDCARSLPRAGRGAARRARLPAGRAGRHDVLGPRARRRRAGPDPAHAQRRAAALADRSATARRDGHDRLPSSLASTSSTRSRCASRAVPSARSPRRARSRRATRTSSSTASSEPRGTC